jgi:predicted anti-sigma-YlaC factor YlaD
MRCDHVRDVLQDHLERLLLPIDRAAVGQHLASCPSCAREAEALAAVASLLTDLPDPEVPSAFTESVMSALPEMLPARQGTGHLLRWGVLAAAVVFAFLASLSLLIRGGGPDVARGTLEPLAASLELAAVLVASAASAAAALLDAASSAIASAGLGAKLAFALLFVSTHAAFVALLVRTRPLVATAAAHRPHVR